MQESKIVEHCDDNIILDKLQGDTITCKTIAGNISTNCSYVESSKFETDTGCMDLKNVHKKTAVYVHQEGELNMTGVHGNLSVLANKGKMNIQLSQLQGECTIHTHDLSASVVNISDEIEQNTVVEVNLLDNNLTSITLDETLQHLSAGLHENKQQFKWPLEQHQPNKLLVVSKNSLTLGKSSWMKMMHLQMQAKNNN